MTTVSSSPFHPDVSQVGYGHIGDSNLHLNVSVPEERKEVKELLEPFVYDFISTSFRPIPLSPLPLISIPSSILFPRPLVLLSIQISDVEVSVRNMVLVK